MIRRIVFTVIAAISLILCVSAVNGYYMVQGMHDLLVEDKKTGNFRGATAAEERSAKEEPAVAAGVFAILPVVWMGFAIRYAVIRTIQGRRRGNNCCTSCGYHLIANTSGVCPECGTILSVNEGRIA